MHKICFPVSDSAGGTYSASPYLLRIFQGPTSEGPEGEVNGRKGKGEGRGEEVEGGIWHPKMLAWCPLCIERLRVHLE